MYVESNQNSLVSNGTTFTQNSLKGLSDKFKSDEKTSRVLKDSVDIQNMDSTITTKVRTLDEAQALMATTKNMILTNSKEAILAHSNLIK